MDRPKEQEGATDLPLRDFTGYLMKRAFNVVREDLVRELRPFGLGMLSFSVLMVVARRPGISQSDLARTLSIKRSNLVSLIDRLEADGILRRGRMQDDRRAHALHLTPEGREMAVRASSAVAGHEARLFASVAPADLAILRRVLGQLMAQAPPDA